MSATVLPPSLTQPAIGDGSFPAGTPIAVPSANGAPTERPVESLARGEKVLTLAGPVTVRHVATTRQEPGRQEPGRQDPGAPPRQRLMPVRVAAGAFGEGQPAADLLLPPESLVHALDATLPQGALVPIGALVNCDTIRREPQSAPVAWVRLELESPGVVIAAGLLVAARIDPAAPPPAPLLPAGPATLALRQRLARAPHAAAAPVEAAPAPDDAPEPPAAPPTAPPVIESLAEPPAGAAPALSIVVDGAALALLEGSDALTWNVMLPAGTGMVRLVSPRGVPATIAESERAGSRRFGVAIRTLLLDEAPIPLDGPAIGDGFHAMESAGSTSWRWTDGEAVVHLPPFPTARRLSVVISDWHQLLQPA